MPHTLVVGGSGMLAELCTALAADGELVSVPARGREKLLRLASLVPAGNIHPLAADYRRPDEVEEILGVAVQSYGAITRTICWAHEEQSADAPYLFARYTEHRFFHVLGSAAADPSNPKRLGRLRESFEARFPALAYHTVVLGFRQDQGAASRWLSNREISQGVLAALSASGK